MRDHVAAERCRGGAEQAVSTRVLLNWWYESNRSSLYAGDSQTKMEHHGGIFGK